MECNKRNSSAALIDTAEWGEELARRVEVAVVLSPSEVVCGDRLLTGQRHASAYEHVRAVVFPELP